MLVYLYADLWSSDIDSSSNVPVINVHQPNQRRIDPSSQRHHRTQKQSNDSDHLLYATRSKVWIERQET